MEQIRVHALLSEMRAVERKFFETVSCHLKDPQMQQEASASKKRMAVLDELFSLCSKSAVLPLSDRSVEDYFKATIDSIAGQDGFVKEPTVRKLIEFARG